MNYNSKLCLKLICENNATITLVDIEEQYFNSVTNQIIDGLYKAIATLHSFPYSQPIRNFIAVKGDDGNFIAKWFPQHLRDVCRAMYRSFVVQDLISDFVFTKQFDEDPEKKFLEFKPLNNPHFRGALVDLNDKEKVKKTFKRWLVLNLERRLNDVEDSKFYEPLIKWRKEKLSQKELETEFPEIKGTFGL